MFSLTSLYLTIMSANNFLLLFIILLLITITKMLTLMIIMFYSLTFKQNKMLFLMIPQ